jgi:ribosomal protein S18 acetylase RimI-like enzyme
MIFRKAHSGDVEAIERIEHRCFGVNERFHRRQIAALSANPRAIVLIAQACPQGDDSGKHLGWGAALVRRHRGPRGKPGACSGRIYSVAVDPDGRGMGIGKKLMTEMMTWLRLRGAGRIYLEVRTDNVAAIALYRKLGFTEIGWIDHYYATGLHALRMMREDPRLAQQKETA